MQLNLSLRASRLIFANIAANFKTTPYRRPEQRTDIIRDDKGFIIFITAPELVRRLTDRFEVRDADTIAVMDTFFMFFREFLTPKDLFRLLKARFEEKPPIVLEKDEKADWDRYQIVVKLHVVRMLAIWLDRYYLAAYDKHVLHDMFMFLNQITVDRCLPEHAVTLLQTHLRACRKGERGQEHTEAFDKIVKLSSTNTPHFPLTAFEPFLPTLQDALNKSRTLPDIMIFTKPDGAEELVRAFTEIESSFFHRCLPKDLMTCDEQNSHPVFDKMNRWSHAVNLWISRCILERRDTEARARIFELFIEVAVGCQQLRNYSSAMSLFLALEASRITRLTQMMDEVSDRHKAMLAGIKDFFGFSGSKQWQHYRDDLRATFGPAIPVLVAVKSDIIKVKAAREIARNKYQPMTGLNGPSGQIVDLMMYKKLREIVRELENCYADYEMPKDRFVTRWLYSSVRPFEDVDYATYDQKYMEESKKIQAPPLRPRGSWHQDELWALGNWN
ncbi:ras guanine nucleotide exchange factor domain-containing protein [Irpex lacteus]|nr:ras guanine nucleotide exchange factor domain-containing protein [Irpex lacteus]